MADNKYSIIREQGEFFDPVPLKYDENDVVNKSNKEDK